MISDHSLEKGFHFGLHRVIHTDWDCAATGRGNHLGRFFDRFGAVVMGAVPNRTASGNVDCGAGFAESSRDTTSGTASGTCDDSYRTPK